MPLCKWLTSLLAISFCYLYVVACDANLEGRGALAEITQEELSEYHQAIDELAQESGMDLLRPTYLPPGTDWKPDTGYGSDENEAVLTFFPGETDGPVAQRPFVRLAQIVDADEQICPPCSRFDESDLQEWSTAGRTFLTQLGRGGPGRVFAVIYFRAQDIRVEARFDWDSPTQTEEMKEEALKVVKSMLEDR